MHRNRYGLPALDKDMVAAVDATDGPTRCLELRDNFFACHGAKDRSIVI